MPKALKIILLLISFVVLAPLVTGLVYRVSTPVNYVVSDYLSGSDNPIASAFYGAVLFSTHGKMSIKQCESEIGLNFIFADKQYRDKEKQVFEFFLSKGADINAISPIDGYSPVHIAVVGNDPQLLNYLISKGADLTVEDQKMGKDVCELLDFLNFRTPNIDRSGLQTVLNQYCPEPDSLKGLTEELSAE